MGVVIPTFDPMLATSDALRPKNPVIEPKFDGVRSIITLHADGVDPVAQWGLLAFSAARGWW